MDLRAFIHTIVFVFLLVFGGSKNAFALPTNNNNPLVPYEVKFADITFQLNDVTRYLIQNELKNIQSNRQHIQNQLDRVSLFLPVVEPMLKDQNLPDDFKYLVSYDKYQSSIETSTSLESGVYWCLDKDKAEDVDLLMNGQLDERKHLIAATKGAAMCLKRNYVLYKNWGTTLFSHISDKKVLSLLEVSRKWSSNNYILLDSPAYSAILQFLAYKIAIEREFPAYKPPVQRIVYEYPYSKGKTLNRISAELKVEPATLSEYNLWLTAKNVPDTECQVLVVVPASRFSEIRTLAELSRKSGLPAKDLGFPILKREESLAKTKGKGGLFFNINELKGLQAEMCDVVVTMAYKADISIERFVEYNDMKEADLLHIGQVYYIEQKKSKASVPFHVVREGETLWDISQMYGVRLANLLDFNRFETVQRLQRGRIVWLQTTRPKNKPIEYVEMPDEFSAIEDLLSAEKQEAFPPKVVTDTLSFIETSSVLAKTKSVESTKNNGSLPKEIDFNSLPLTQEIAKESNRNTATASTKNNVPKEIDLNSLPLSQEIRKEQSKNVNLSKSIDSKDVALNQEEENKVLVKGEKLKKEDKKPYSEQVLNREENKSDSKYVYHTVRKDETLFRISVNYNVSVENLWKMNNLSSTIIEVGTVLKIKRL
jgi:membrane-bound lytic murein transglycosylase D